MLLGDSASCPHCGHVLDAARASEFISLIPSEALEDSEQEEPCPQCGERVRVGMVRCWNCGSFIHQEMEAAYREMQATPSPIVYSPLPGHDVPASDHAPISEPEPTPEQFDPDSGSGDDGDFELAGTVSTYDDDSSFELKIPGQGWENTAPEPAHEADARPDHRHTDDDPTDSDDGYELQVPVEASTDSGEAEQEPEMEFGELAEPAAEQDPAGEQPDEAATSADVGAEDAGSPDAAAAIDAGGTPHSVTTAGDVLLAAALAEEHESARRPARRSKGGKGDKEEGAGLVVFCPNGHRIQVQDRYRGRAGRCPRCKALFVVPDKTAPLAAAPAAGEPAAPQAEAAATTGVTAGNYKNWLFDLKLHQVVPTKLKLKPGSLTNEYDTADVGFSESEIVVATVFKGGGAFRAASERKKKPLARESMLAHLSAKKSVSKLPVPAHLLIQGSEASQLKVVQPAPPDEESLFAGVPVFGPGRVAVRLPGVGEGGLRQYLSFTISEFRRFSELLATLSGITEFGANLGIPLTVRFAEAKCHYSDVALQIAQDLEWYRNDPAFKLVLIGRKCQGCGLVVSEDARKKEKIGGVSGSSIAKAPCPKCKAKFGTNSLFGLENAPVAATSTPSA